MMYQQLEALIRGNLHLEEDERAILLERAKSLALSEVRQLIEIFEKDGEEIRILIDLMKGKQEAFSHGGDAFKEVEAQEEQLLQQMAEE